MNKRTLSEECRVFVSRKTADREVVGRDTRIRRELEKMSRRLHFYDADDIPAGENWRDSIRKELGRANILLLILTKPSRKEFDWPLYEAGLFDSLNETGGRLVCIYPAAETPPSQLDNIEGVEATQVEMVNLLKRLFSEKEFTLTTEPLNDRLEAEDFEEIAKEICNGINGKTGHDLANLTYTNPYVQLVLRAGESTLSEDVFIESDQRSLRKLFHLSPSPPNGEYWRWGDIEGAVDLGESDPGKFNLRWIHELKTAVALMRSGRTEDRQLRSRFIAKDQKIWGPEIEVCRSYESGVLRVDVSFSPRVHESWLKNADPAVALAANLGLASRIRHEVVETYLSRLPRWRRGEAEKTQGFSELEKIVDVVEHDGFFIRWLTDNQNAKAFESRELVKLVELETHFAGEIHPKLHGAIQQRDVDGTQEALEMWRNNNADFFTIGIPRYTRMLDLDSLLREAS